MRTVSAALALLLAACGSAPPPPPPPPTAAPAGPSASDILGCEVDGAPATGKLADYSLPAVPCWTNRYVARIDENVRFFAMSALMAGEGLSRVQAIEVQNLYRDLMRAEPERDRNAALDAAIARAKAGELESGLDPAALAAAKFIVVFDLDETLYDQRRATAECTDATFEYQSSEGTKTKYIKMAPDWQNTIARIRALGGLVAIFSANVDEQTLQNLSHVMLDGKPLTESDAIAGILTNSHMVQQSKLEPPGTVAEPWKGTSVFEPSKDLRAFDETLERVIIVDDNPLRLFQFRNARIFPKFHADALCRAEDPELRAAYEGAMPAVAREIEESVAWMDAHPGATFVGAYLPYSDRGQVAVRFLMDTRGWDAARAIEYVRLHPDVVGP